MAIYKVMNTGEYSKFQDDASYFTAIGGIFGHARYVGCVNLNSIRTAAQEMFEHAKSCGKNSGKRLRHSVLSFEERDKVTAEMAARMAEMIMMYYSENYQMVYAVHDDAYHVHIHFMMNQIGLDGTRYQSNRADLRDFKEWMYMATHRTIRLME